MISKINNMEVVSFNTFIEYLHIFLPTDAWKAPINLSQEAHERVKRSLTEAGIEQRNKRLKMNHIREEIPENIICVEIPSFKPPKVMFSNVMDLDGLKNVVE